MIYNYLKPSYDNYIKTNKMTILLKEILNNKELSLKQLSSLLPQIDNEEGTKETINEEENEMKDINIETFYKYLDNIYSNEIGINGLDNLNKLYNTENYEVIRKYFDENSFELLLKLLKIGLNHNTLRLLIKNNMKKDEVLKLINSEIDVKIIELIIKENLSFDIINELVKKSDFNLLLLKECLKNEINLNDLLNEVRNNDKKLNAIEIYEKISNKKFESYKPIDEKVKILNIRKNSNPNPSNDNITIDIKCKGRKIEKKNNSSILESDIYNMKISENINNNYNQNILLLNKEDFPLLPSEKEIINAYRQLKIKPDIIYSDIKRKLEDAEEIINKQGGPITIDQTKYLESINDKMNMLNYITANESDYKDLRKEIDTDIMQLRRYLKKYGLKLVNKDINSKIREYISLRASKKEREKKNLKSMEELSKKEKEESEIIENKEEEEEEEENDIMDPEHLRYNKDILTGKKVFNLNSNEMREELKFGEGFGNDFEILKSDKYHKEINNINDISEVNPAVYAAVYIIFIIIQLQFLPRESKYSLDVEPTVKKSYANLLKSEISAIGRRKTSVAKVTITPGEGLVTVNNRSFIDYFQREYYRDQICLPFYITYTTGMFDVKCDVRGGGLTGQCDAIKLGISRCLQELESDLTPQLKMGKLLTRDPRMVERKKFGHKKARKSFQWNRR